MLYREPKLLKEDLAELLIELGIAVSVLYREPKLLKVKDGTHVCNPTNKVSVLYREPKLLKGVMSFASSSATSTSFSALP